MKAILTAVSRDSRLEPLNCNQADALLPVLNQPLVKLSVHRLSAAGYSVCVLAGQDYNQIKTVLENRKVEVVQVDQDDVLAQCIHQNLPRSGPVLLASASTLITDSDLQALHHDENVVLEDESVAGSTVTMPALASISCERAKSILTDPKVFALNKMTDVMDVIAQHLPDRKTGTSRCLVYPWNLIEASVSELRNLREVTNHGEVSPLAEINGPVIIGKGSRIRSGCTIDGPVVIGEGCLIGPNAYIRPDTVIGDGTIIGHGVELYDTVIFSNSTCKHRSYIGHSVIGSHVNLGAGFITSDYRHDGKSHTTRIQGIRMDSGRRKLGAFVGDNVKTGIHTSLYPGRKLWPDSTTRPGEVVDEDKD
jgi:NDP-sugar pyrophosphorylase family protein